MDPMSTIVASEMDNIFRVEKVLNIMCKKTDRILTIIENLGKISGN